LPVEVRFARVGDADTITPNLRPSDHDELVAASGPDVLGQLREAVELSHGRLGPMSFVAEHQGEIVALFGFVPAAALSNTAYPWLVGTPGLGRVPRMLNRLARSYCGVVLGEYPLLFNYADARNTASIVWLKRLGFTFGEAQPFGVEGLPFHRFEMRGPFV
jgi:hypothetical protein